MSLKTRHPCCVAAQAASGGHAVLWAVPGVAMAGALQELWQYSVCLLRHHAHAGTDVRLLALPHTSTPALIPQPLHSWQVMLCSLTSCHKYAYTYIHV